MDGSRPSWTAFMMAALRARHFVSTPPPRILDDSLAMPFCGFTSPDQPNAVYERLVEGLSRFGERALAEELATDLMIAGCARSRFFEDRLAEARAGGVDQIVILGAGLDSTAYRCGALTAGATVFEVDHPATQAGKREMLASIGLAPPANLSFLPFDFEAQSLADALREGGVRSHQPTIFGWLGVQPYLADETVMATLETIAAFPAGSEVVLDLIVSTGSAPDEDAMLAGSRQALASAGEAFRSTYAPDDFAARLRERGFAEIIMTSFQDWLRDNAERLGGHYVKKRNTSVLVAARL
jgi:methyltransferase (TIGR00027 family)